MWKSLFMVGVLSCSSAPAPAQEPPDLLIRNGEIIDGSGKKAFRADIAIRRGVIVELGDLRGRKAKELMDATGLVVAPGFIDAHTHADGIKRNPLKVISLEEAVRKMTSLPAAQFRFSKRGMIRKGYAADLVLFNRETVSDRAAYGNPHQYPDGIPIVIVNGVPVLRDGKSTGARPGQILASSPGR